jgi:flavin-dependent dehydrogenase
MNLKVNNMKATLEFNLPEEKDEYDFANNGLNYYLTLVEFDHWLRSEYKYNGNEAMFEVREKLQQFINDNNIKI